MAVCRCPGATQHADPYDRLITGRRTKGWGMSRFPIAIAIVAAAILAGSLTGCGSSPQSSQAASTQAPATRTPVTTAPVTTAPATQASSPEPDAPPTTNPATTMELWCGPVSDIVQIPSLAQWKANANVVNNAQGSVALTIQTTVRAIESMTRPGGPYSTAASVVPLAQALCGEARMAYKVPPPADLGDYDTAMADFLEASEVMRSVPGGTAASAEEAVRPDLNAGTAALNAFLAAIGAAPSSGPAATVTPAAVPSPSASACVVPDVVDDHEAFAVSAVQTAGLRAAVDTKADPGAPALPAGLVWGQDPVPQDEPCGSTVTLDVQP